MLKEEVEGFLKKDRYRLILCMVFILGIGLRLYKLGEHNFWFDEYATFFLQSKFNLSDILRLNQYLIGGSLYHILLKLWLTFFPESEFGLRSLSMLFGAFSILLIYKLGKLLFDRKVGLISAFILAISPMHIWYSQEARGYALSTFLLMLSVYFFIAALKNDKRSLWTGFILSSILALYSNYLCLYIVIIAAAVLLFKKYKKLTYGLVSLCIIILVFLPQLSILIKQVSSIKDNFWVPKPYFNSMVITFENFNIGYNSTAWAYFFIFIVFSFLFILAIKCWWSKKKLELLSLILFLFVPIIFTYIISQKVPIYIDRYLMFFSPFYYIIIASGFSAIKAHSIKFFIFLITLTAFSLSLFNYYNYQMPVGLFHHVGVHVKKPLNPAADYINERFTEGDCLGFANPEIMAIFYYIQGLISKQVDIFNFVMKSKLDKYWDSIGSKAGYNRYIPGFALPKSHVVGLDVEESYRNFQKYRFKRLWFITTSWSRGGILDPHAMAVRLWLRNNYSILESKEFDGIFIDLYSKK